MNPIINLLQDKPPHPYHHPATTYSIKYSPSNERRLLKAFLLGYLQKMFRELFQEQLQEFKPQSSLECYAMDSRIIQLLIHGIVDTGEYSLEGIAYHTHIPFDIIYDAACGISNEFSITVWTKLVELYLEVKPDVHQLFMERLITNNTQLPHQAIHSSK